MRLLLLLLTLTPFLTGCFTIRKLPPLRASEIHSNTSYLGVKVKADALGINVTESKLVAEHAEWDISFPGFSHTTIVKGYEQRIPKEDR